MRKNLGRFDWEVGKKDEERAPPAQEAGPARPRPDLLPPDEKRGLHQVDMKMLHPAKRQGAHDVGLVHKAVMHQHRVEALADFLDLQAALVRYMRYTRGIDLQDDDALMQRLVML